MKSRFSSLLSATLAAALLAGCGSSGISGTPDSSIQGQDNGNVYVPPVDLGGGVSAYPVPFKAKGVSQAEQAQGVLSTSTTSAPLRTDNLLKVKVTLNPATRNEGTPVYTNFTANYSCATIAVTLQVEQNGTYIDLATVTTGRITAAGTSGCSGSKESETINFSGYMLPGHGDVKIKVQAATSNFNCLAAQMYPYNYPYGYYQNVCSQNPMQSIYQYHVVNGIAEAQVNGTDFN